MIKLARLCIQCCANLKCYVFLLIFSYNFLIAWWLQFYYTDQKLLDSKKSDVLKSLYLQFYKLILKAKKSTPNVMLYGEMGRYPIDLKVKSRMIVFWQRIVNGRSDKISNKL